MTEENGSYSFSNTVPPKDILQTNRIVSASETNDIVVINLKPEENKNSQPKRLSSGLKEVHQSPSLSSQIKPPLYTPGNKVAFTQRHYLKQTLMLTMAIILTMS